MSQVNIEEIKTEITPSVTVEEVVVPAKKKRGRKPNPDKKKNYFGDEEEAAFMRYVSSTDQAERDKIFRETLYPVFTKMVESIIRRYILFTPMEDFNDTFCDTMSFLITKVNNFDPTKGKKAYSYCGTVCKNYLILKRTQATKKRNKIASYDAMFSGYEKDTRVSSNREMEIMKFNEDLIQNTVKEIKNMLSPEHIDELTINEQKIGYALIEMLTNWEDIFKCLETKKFNKTSVSFFIKEYTMLNTKEVRDAMKKYKCLYFLTKKNMLDE